MLSKTTRNRKATKARQKSQWTGGCCSYQLYFVCCTPVFVVLLLLVLVLVFLLLSCFSEYCYVYCSSPSLSHSCSHQVFINVCFLTKWIQILGVNALSDCTMKTVCHCHVYNHKLITPTIHQHFSSSGITGPAPKESNHGFTIASCLVQQ